jgi:hypothetical protein
MFWGLLVLGGKSQNKTNKETGMYTELQVRVIESTMKNYKFRFYS